MRFDIAGFFTNKRGNIATMAALLAPVFLAVAAIGVDLSSLYLERRSLQSLADIASISASTNVARASQSVMAHLHDNGVNAVLMVGSYDSSLVKGKDDDLTRVWVEPGKYTPNQALAVDKRFVPGLNAPNSVRVTLSRPGKLFFGQSLIGRPVVSAKGTAMANTEAAFSIGSRLASVDGGILNSLLGSLLGTTISLQAGDYRALLNTDINVLSFLDALATQVKLTAGTYDDLLKTEASVGQIANALAAVSTSNNDAKIGLGLFGRDAAALKTKLPIGQLLDLGSLAKLGLQGGANYGVTANVMQLLSAAVMLGGKHQAEVNSGIDLPGLAKVTLKLAVGEPMQKTPFFAVGAEGSMVRTAQVRLLLSVDVFNDGIVSLLANVHLPIFVDVASAEGELKSISCPTGRPESATVTLGVKPGVAGVYIGDPNADYYNFNKAPVVVETKIAEIKAILIPLIAVKTRVAVPLGNTRQELRTFTAADIAAKRIQTVSTSNLTGSLFAALVSGLDLKVELLGLLPLPLSTITQLLGTLLTPLGPGLDSLIFNVLQLLGVRIGEADVQVTGVVCQRAVLVQ